MKIKCTRILIILLLISNAYSQCLTEVEKQSLNRFNEFYGDVPNMIDCSKKEQNTLSEFVCNHSDYFELFRYVSQSNVYEYENATKQEVNHQTFNKKYKEAFLKKFDSNPINPNHLCFDLKAYIISVWGGWGNPYYVVNINDNKRTFRLIAFENKNGAVLTDRDGYKIYMGKSCDVADSKNNKGRWFHEADTYTIEMNGTQLYFSADSLNLEQYDCHK